jgi:hypothetical protein
MLCIDRRLMAEHPTELPWDWSVTLLQRREEALQPFSGCPVTSYGV